MMQDESQPSAVEQVADAVNGEAQAAPTQPAADGTVDAVNRIAARLFGEDSWAAQEVVGNPVAIWIAAAALAVAVYFIVWWGRLLVINRVQAWSKRTDTKLDDVFVALLKKVRRFFAFAVAIWAASLLLALPGQVYSILRVVLVIAFSIQAAMLAGVIVEFALERLLAKHDDEEDTEARRDALKTSVGILKFIGLVIVYSIIALVALDNMGIDVTAMVASLGIGGIAIALAVQNVLGDLFGSLTIILDKPFEVGDFVVTDKYAGTVERVGLKTTRIRALSGEQLVFANSDLLSSRLQNFKRMQERRILFTVGVTYDTPIEKLEKIPDMLKTAVEAAGNSRHDRSHFARFANSWLEYETVYFVKVPDYNSYMDTQQKINLQLVREFRKSDIEFAFPTQTLWHEGLPEFIEPKSQARGKGDNGQGDGKAGSSRERESASRS